MLYARGTLNHLIVTHRVLGGRCGSGDDPRPPGKALPMPRGPRLDAPGVLCQGARPGALHHRPGRPGPPRLRPESPRPAGPGAAHSSAKALGPVRVEGGCACETWREAAGNLRAARFPIITALAPLRPSPTLLVPANRPPPAIRFWATTPSTEKARAGASVPFYPSLQHFPPPTPSDHGSAAEWDLAIGKKGLA